MIPNRKQANDPRCGPQMIPLEMGEWHGVLFPAVFFFIFVFIYFHQLTDELDDYKEKNFGQSKLSFKCNSPDKIILYSLDNSSGKLQEKNRARRR